MRKTGEGMWRGSSRQQGEGRPLGRSGIRASTVRSHARMWGEAGGKKRESSRQGEHVPKS
jgi:hypothetical protein